jgi:hypothetical protein
MRIINDLCERKETEKWQRVKALQASFDPEKHQSSGRSWRLPISISF